MSKKAALLTVSFFMVFIAFTTLFFASRMGDAVATGKASELSASDSLFYEYSSMERALSNIASGSMNITFSDSSSNTYADIWTYVPIRSNLDNAERLMNFCQQNSRRTIKADLDFSSILVLPQNVSFSSSGTKIITLPNAPEQAAGEIKGYSIDIYWDGTAQPIDEDVVESPDGIPFSINVYSVHGQKLRNYQAVLDPDAMSNITLHLSSVNQTPQYTKIVNVSLNSPGKLEISPEAGVSFYLHERMILEKQEETSYALFNRANLSIADPVFGIQKNGEVRI